MILARRPLTESVRRVVGTEEQIARRIEALLSRMRGLYDELLEKYPSGDLRLAMIAAPGNILRSYQLFFAMVVSTVTHESWWKQSFGPVAPNENDKDAIKNLDTTSRYSFFVFFLSHIEWSLRKLVTHLSPGACRYGGAEFKAIHDHVLTLLGLRQYIPLYDLCRTVRNCVHSNAIYVARNGVDAEIAWKGATYVFRHMMPVDFMTYDMILQLYDDLIDSLEAMLAHPMVASNAFIEDRLA